MVLTAFILWFFAFLGIAVIYGGPKIFAAIFKKEFSERTNNLIKLVGVLFSAAAMVLLYTTGLLK